MQTLTVEGPALFMEQSYYEYAQGSSSVDVRVRLQGVNTLPVSANLTVQHRTLPGTSATPTNGDNLTFWLSPPQLVWEAEKPGLQIVQLKMSGDTGLFGSGGLLVSIDAAENADIQTENSTSILTALDDERLLVNFALQPNQARSYPLLERAAPPEARPSVGRSTI